MKGDRDGTVPHTDGQDAEVVPSVAIRAHLRAVTARAHDARVHLGSIQSVHGNRVHFRPSSGGVAMVSLLPGRPQRGPSGIRNLERLAANFEAEFQRYCVDVPQGRPTPEKRLQSFLLRDAYAHGRRMAALNDASGRTAKPVDLRFVLDELLLPLGEGKRVVCDLLLLRRTPSGECVPVVMELKSSRDMTRLLEQVGGYAALVGAHVPEFEELFGAVLDEAVSFTGPCEKWIVWPGLETARRPGVDADSSSAADRREAELGAMGIRVVTYTDMDGVFEFRAGAGVP